MTEADVSGLDKVSPRTGRDTAERDVPVKRLENDAKLREIYEFGRKLGQGTFGVVYEATHIETQTKWAIKEVCRPEAGSLKVEMLEHEINILKKVNHNNIIHLKEVYDTPRMMYLVTELCDGGELRQLLHRKGFFTEDETRHIICSLADAVAYLHKRSIVHRDLKLENILVKNSPDADDNERINIKVTDFGLSVRTGVGIENIMTEPCGTLGYMAPEIMSGHGYSLWCDLWSVGIVMYMLLCGESPFVSRKKAKLFDEIMSKEIPFTQPIWSEVSDSAKTVVMCLLNTNPADRMSADQLLNNPWITGDTNVPVIESNAMDMMRNQLEEKEREKTLEDLSLASSQDTQIPPPVPSAASPERDSNHKSPDKVGPEKDRSLCGASTSTKAVMYQTKNSGVGLQQDKRRNGMETSGPSQTTTAKSHAGVKPTAQQSAKQHRPQEKKDHSNLQKSASDISKAENQRARTGARKSPGSSKTHNHSEDN